MEIRGPRDTWKRQPRLHVQGWLLPPPHAPPTPVPSERHILWDDVPGSEGTSCFPSRGLSTGLWLQGRGELAHSDAHGCGVS